MAEANVRHLKSQASEMLRAVRERRARYVITHRGRPVAVLSPVDEAASERRIDDMPEDAWEELVRLGHQIAKGRRSRQSPSEFLSKMRR